MNEKKTITLDIEGSPPAAYHTIQDTTENNNTRERKRFYVAQ